MMNKRKIFSIFISLILISTFLASVITIRKNIEGKDVNNCQFHEFYTPDLKVVSIQISQANKLGELIKKGLDIINFKDLKVIAYINNSELKWLNDSDFKLEILYENLEDMNEELFPPEIMLQFHSYAEMTAELEEIVENYPEITKLYSLGSSIQGRTIWGLKITNNPNVEENEPEVRICGAHHGNEFMSVEIPLLLSWYLVENYESDPIIKDLIESREIWIIPMVNPDGREASTRYNANGVDINRDYGYMWDGQGNSPLPFSQPETQSIRNNALDNNFVLSLSFHCYGDIVNYIWNYKGEPVADNEMVVLLSEQYGSYNGYWVVEGYEWYQTRGDTNDFSYGCRGDIDWTIEIQNEDIQQAWDLNREAIIEIIDAADIGLAGTIKDELTGDPLAATVWVEEVYWPCFTDPKLGDYHRILSPGTYIVHFQSNGYEEKLYNIEILDTDEPKVFNVTLTPSNNYYAYQVTSCNFYDPYSYPNNFQNNPTEAIFALGHKDDISASLGNGGTIVLDMGEGTEIFDLPNEPDFKIFEGDETEDKYHVYVSEEWNGPWIYMGLAKGTTEFDLADKSVETARYIKIEDDADGDPYEDNPGVDIDAIQNLAKTNFNTSPNQPEPPSGPTVGITGLEYEFSISTIDPEGDNIYYKFDWGDKTYTGWLGPYNSGETCEAKHSWSEDGKYNIKVKATDSHSQTSWSDPLFIRISDRPIFEIDSIKGGLFKVSSTIKNIGAIEATNINWRILLEGGAFIGKETTGKVTIPMEDKTTVSSRFIIGYGPTQVKVEAWIEDGHSDSHKQGGFVYFFFINVNPGG